MSRLYACGRHNIDTGLRKRWLFGTQKGTRSDFFLQTEWFLDGMTSLGVQIKIFGVRRNPFDFCGVWAFACPVFF